MKEVKLPVADTGMQHEGYCECDEKRTVQCDANRHPHCLYARAQVNVKGQS